MNPGIETKLNGAFIKYNPAINEMINPNVPKPLPIFKPKKSCLNTFLNTKLFIFKKTNIYWAEMPEWSNGSGLGPDSLVLT